MRLVINTQELAGVAAAKGLHDMPGEMAVESANAAAAAAKAAVTASRRAVAEADAAHIAARVQLSCG